MTFDKLRRHKRAKPSPVPTGVVGHLGGPKRPRLTLRPGGDWVLVSDVRVPGSPGLATAAVGERGTVVLGTL